MTGSNLGKALIVSFLLPGNLSPRYIIYGFTLGISLSNSRLESQSLGSVTPPPPPPRRRLPVANEMGDAAWLEGRLAFPLLDGKAVTGTAYHLLGSVYGHAGGTGQLAIGYNRAHVSLLDGVVERRCLDSGVGDVGRLRASSQAPGPDARPCQRLAWGLASVGTVVRVVVGGPLDRRVGGLFLLLVRRDLANRTRGLGQPSGRRV